MFQVFFLKIAPLWLAIALGYLSGALRIFPEPDKAVDVLNRFALYFGFPLLIFQGFCRPELQLSSNPGFYALHLLQAGCVVGGIVAAGALFPSLHQARGSLVLGSLFGNVAYLGIPLGVLLLGAPQLGLISSSVALQVFLAMALGPFCLLLWGQEGERPSWSRLRGSLLKQPLLWAPVLGFLARMLPPKQLAVVARPLSFFAASAAPVALFLLGLHIWNHQKKLLRWDPAALGLLASKLLFVPVTCGLLGTGFLSFGWISVQEFRVVLLLSLMPTAITTFSIARDFRQNEDLMAQAILLSTAVSLLLLPGLCGWLL